MKTIKLLFLLLLIINFTAQAQWHRQEANTAEGLNDVFCINADTVFAVGNAGVILKTVDGGENWIHKTSDFTGYLWKIRFADDTTSYAIGKQGIIKTTDCGETWTILDTAEDSLYSVSCVNKDTVYISGVNGLIQKTENGGQTWVTQDPGIIETVTNIQFVNDTLGYATAGTIYEDNYFLKSVDTGQNWQAQFMGGGGNTLYSFAMIHLGILEELIYLKLLTVVKIGNIFQSDGSQIVTLSFVIIPIQFG